MQNSPPPLRFCLHSKPWREIRRKTNSVIRFDSSRGRGHHLHPHSRSRKRELITVGWIGRASCRWTWSANKINLQATGNDKGVSWNLTVLARLCSCFYRENDALKCKWVGPKESLRNLYCSKTKLSSIAYCKVRTIYFTFKQFRVQFSMTSTNCKRVFNRPFLGDLPSMCRSPASRRGSRRRARSRPRGTTGWRSIRPSVDKFQIF